jgi:hypothetical protein
MGTRSNQRQTHQHPHNLGAMSTLYIGLGHKARQGKNVVASVIKERGGDKVREYALADELKKYCKANHDELVKTHNLDTSVCKADSIYGYVNVLQFVGTNLFREQNPNHWVELLDKRIRADRPEIALITDVRFPNEAEYVHGRDGVLVKIVRMMPDGTQYISTDRDPKHPSETALDTYTDWDFVILGADGEVQALQDVASQLYDMLTDPDMANVAAGVVPEGVSECF